MAAAGPKRIPAAGCLPQPAQAAAGATYRGNQVVGEGYPLPQPTREEKNQAPSAAGAGSAGILKLPRTLRRRFSAVAPRDGGIGSPSPEAAA